MRRGEVYWYTFKAPDKKRPVVIVTRNHGISYLTSLTVAPLTTTLRENVSQVYLTPFDDGVVHESVVNCDALVTVPKSRLQNRITLLSSERMSEIDDAITFALGIDRP